MAAVIGGLPVALSGQWLQARVRARGYGGSAAPAMALRTFVGLDAFPLKLARARSMTTSMFRGASHHDGPPAPARLRDRLPRGQTLPRASWVRRHRWMTAVAWAHVPALFAFGLITGHSVAHSGLDVTPVALFALLAGRQGLTRRARAAMVCVALLTSSSLLVHLWGGQTEGHFHFFVMVTLLATYEEWFPYLLAFVYVLVHHGLMGALDAASVFNHPAAQEHPWRWAAVHALFISALGVVNVVSWRLNEGARDATRASDLRFRSAFEDAPTGMALVGLDGTMQRVNAALCAATGRAEETLLGTALHDLTPEADRDDALWPPNAGGEQERRFARADGSVGWGLWQHSLVRDHGGAPAYWVCHMRDISQRKRAERQLEYQAHHDPLTGLPNRALFLQRVHELIDRGDGESRSALRRLRQLQGHQRLTRPRSRRPSAGGRRRPAAARAAPRRS